jgi:hypothetical protein
MKKIILLYFFLITQLLFAQQSYNTNIIANLTGGPCNGGLFEHSNRLHLGADKTLIILDTSNPGSPVEINRYYVGLAIYQIFANDDLCILSTRTASGFWWIYILDISNEENIIKLCEFTLNYKIPIKNILIKENLLIIPTRTQILFYDIINPSSPQLLNAINFEESNSHFDIVNDYAIINHFNYPYDSTKIFIYDISDIYAPQLVSTFPESGFDRRYSFVIRDSILLSFGQDLGIVDISDPYSPYEVSAINLPSYCYSGVGSRDTILFLNTAEGDLYSINFRNINIPLLIDTTNISELSSIYIADNFLYVAKNQLDIYDTSDPINLTLSNIFEYYFYLDGIHYSDNNLFTINLPNQIRSIDISDPLNPYYRTSLQLNFNVLEYPKFTGNSNYLFLGEITDEIHIFDISDKDTIVEISEISIPTDYYVRTIYSNDSLLIVSYGVPSLTEVYDITDPFNPHFLSSFGRKYEALAMDSAFFFGATTGSVFDIYDLTDPSNPIFVQNVWLYTDEVIRTLDVNQKVISISTGYIEYKLILYEIDDYYNPPLRRGTFNTNGDFSLLIQRVDDFIFLHHGTSYLSKINISDLSYPNEVAMFNENFNMRNFWIENDIAYAVSIRGLFVIDFDDPSHVGSESVSSSELFFLMQNYPNPFNPTTTISYQIPEKGFVTLKVYDVLGNEVATLVNEESATGGAGSYEVEFNATGLPSGIYFYQLRTGEFIETKKMILLK